MFGDLFFKSKNQGEFHEEARAALECLKIGTVEHRASPNHPPLEEYLRGECLGFDLVVWIRDDAPEFIDYPYYLGVTAKRVKLLSRSFCTELADAMARELTLQGYEVVRPLNLQRPGSGRLVYRLDPDPTLPQSDRVQAELVVGKMRDGVR